MQRFPALGVPERPGCESGSQASHSARCPSPRCIHLGAIAASPRCQSSATCAERQEPARNSHACSAAPASLQCNDGEVRRIRTPSVALITSAPRSPDEEFLHRRRRYTVMMSLRVVCLIAAALTYSISLWLALALIAGGAVLPWCAVLIANDGPPRKRRAPVAHPPTAARELPSPPPERIIEY